MIHVTLGHTPDDLMPYQDATDGGGYKIDPAHPYYIEVWTEGAPARTVIASAPDLRTLREQVRGLHRAWDYAEVRHKITMDPYVRERWWLVR